MISAFLAATLLCMLVANLPDSELRRKASPVTQRYLNALGLDQNWGVFAPDPRRESLALEGRVAFAWGGGGIWRPPESGALVGAYRDYRWRKFLENAVSPRQRVLWRPTAVFAARELESEGGGRGPARVVLVRRSQALRPPGRRPARGRWRELRFYHGAVR